MVIVMAEIDADVEVFVIPLRFMVAAPLPCRVHPGHVVADLAALFAVAAGIAIDPGAIGGQPPLAVLPPIPIGAGGAAKR